MAYAWGTDGLTAGTIAGHLAAVKLFHRQERGFELFLPHPWIVDALKEVTCSHTKAGTKSRIPRPVAWSVLLTGESWCHQWGPRGAGAVTSTRDFVFFLARRAKCSRARKDAGTMGTYCAVGMWFSFGSVPNSIGQCGVRLIASRFGWLL